MAYQAYQGLRGQAYVSRTLTSDARADNLPDVDGKAKTGKWVLFILPLITVLREGLEAVVFVGGVSLGQPATSIPVAAIVGLVCGFIVGLIIYEFASRTST